MPPAPEVAGMETKSIKGKIQLGALLLPGLAIFLVFTMYPMLRLFWVSFREWTLSSMVNQPFIGLGNYIAVSTDRTFWTVFVNSLVYTLVTVPGQMMLGLFVAVLINNIKRLQVTFRVVYYLPVITSWVIASLVFRYVFNTEGLLNYLLTRVLHVSGANIRWLDSRWSGLTVAMVLGIWKGVGWNMVIFLAALQQVSADLYEAAEMDGCNRWKQFIHVTLPSIRGTILFALVMLSIGGFSVFTSIKLITGGKPAHLTDTLLTWMYFKSFSTGDFGYAAALSFVMALALGILSALQFRLMKSQDAV